MKKESNANDDLQFEKADFEGADSSAHVACFACSTPLGDSYFEINGRTACESCKSGIESSFQGGSRYGRIMKAMGFGAVAAILGALIYFAVLKLTGYEVGLISILVGFMVGKAVFVGSGQRGGGVYQMMAIGLTYLAIVSTYVPFVLEGIGEVEEGAASEQLAGQTVFEDEIAVSSDGDPSQLHSLESGEIAQNDISAEQLSIGEILIGLTTLVVVILAMPFLAGFENILGLLIIAFGLYQAWALNRRTVITITGPFRIKAENT